MAKKGIDKLFQDLQLHSFNARVLSYLALFIAFVAVATYLHIPGPSSSYFNLGEVAIYIIALTFGSRAGGIAGAVGSALMDLILGYPIWIPFTFVVKGLEGWVVGRIACQEDFKNNILAVVAGGNIMVIGYALAKGLLFSWPVVLPEIGIDYAQMLIGGLIAIPISQQLNHYFRK